MKRMKFGQRSSRAKGKGPPKDIDEYLAGIQEPARSSLDQVSVAIRSAAPAEARLNPSNGGEFATIRGGESPPPFSAICLPLSP